MKKENRITTSKYNKYTFFFVNMYHQLSKPSNLFFLLTMVLLTVPKISPFNPYTYLLAFSLVTGTSMIKDGIEDYRRHKEDKRINTKLVTIAYIENNIIVSKEIYVEDLKKGDFVILKGNEDVPGDSVFLLSKIRNKDHCKRYCFVDSSNLDGESNLKKKTTCLIEPCQEIRAPSSSEQLLYEFCECEYNLINKITDSSIKDTGDVFNKFECTLEINNREILCNERNVLLRGMKIKNVEYALVYVVAVGEQTKLGKSNVMSRKGTSLFEIELTKIVMIIFVIYFFLLVSTSILGSLFLRKSNIPYLYLGKHLSADALKLTGTNYILFSYLIPLSLFVTLEVSRMFHSSYISNDEKMVKDGVHSVCRNSNVTEDLGMIEYILSDKTGTLTKNKMVFKKIHLLGDQNISNLDSLTFKFKSAEELMSFLDISDKTSLTLRKIFFTLVLTCCNSVEPLNNKLEGISQDEICILEKLKDNNIELIRREDNFVVIKIGEVLLKCDIECILDFSSSRQRMSVIVRLFNKFYILSKGSDQMIISEKKIKFRTSSPEAVSKIINTNSSYRTLIAAYKEIPPTVFSNFKTKYNSIKLDNREIKENELFSSLEENMEYLGTTFIADELQDNVKETINSLKGANIKIWMITGDKKETAISCAIDSGLMASFNDAEVIAIEGSRINEYSNLLTYKSVILYRSTPKQKSEIAHKFREFKKNTLAIGDGNNDVPMLLTSNVGVGILGKEGNQAGISADFAIPDFQSLKYLLLIHGRYNFIRFSKVTLNALYKNIYLIIIQYLYNFFTGFSGKPVYNNFFLNYYNVFFTSLIPASICCFDKDYPEDYLLQNPKKYKETKSYFSKSVILLGIVYGILQGLIVFLFLFGVIFVKDLISNTGKVGGYNGLNNLVSLVVFFSVFLGQIRVISYYTVYSYLAIFLSLFLFFITLFVIQDTSFGGNMWILMSIPSAYFIFIFLILVSYMAEICLSTIFSRLVNEKEV